MTLAEELLGLIRGEWTLLAKDNLESQMAQLSDEMPPILMLKFDEWTPYKDWLSASAKGGIRLIAPISTQKTGTPEIMIAQAALQIFYSETEGELTIPHVETGSPGTYLVSRAYFGKKEILAALSADKRTEIYAPIFESQL